MKQFIIVLLFLTGSLNADVSKYEYERSNAAAKEAFDDMDCDFGDCQKPEPKPKVIIKEKVVEKIVEKPVIQEKIIIKEKIVQRPQQATQTTVSGVYASCLQIKQANPSAQSGEYELKIDGRYYNTYCDMDTAGGGWTQFAYIDDASNNFSKSVNLGTFDMRECNNKQVCSINIDNLYKSSKESFDLMIKYGKRNEFTKVLKGFYKNKGNYFTKPTFRAHQIGEHGMIGDHSVQGYYATYCAKAGSCNGNGMDYMNFSTNGVYPSSANDVPCGFYGYGNGWKDCDKSDNLHVMKYFIREN